MGQAYFQVSEGYYTSNVSQWTVYTYLNEMTVSTPTFNLPICSTAAGYATSVSKNEAKVFYNISAYARGTTPLGSAYVNYLQGPLTDGYYSWGPGAWVYPPLTNDTISGATCYTSWLFDSTNATSRTANITFKFCNAALYSKNTSGSTWNLYNSDSTWRDMVGGATITLNAPPTFSIPSSVTLSPTTYTYKGYTNASVKVTSPSAQYGGYITSIKFKIGTQEIENTYTSTNQPSSSGVTLTMSPLNVTGENLIPTVTITDSRGQVTTKTLNAITVKEYHNPTVSILNIEHINNDGTPNDEGTYALITAQFTCTKDGISNLISPTVSLKNSDGSTISGFTPTFTWYTTRNSSTFELSGAVTWSNVVTAQILYLKVGNSLNINNAYQIQITPRDSDVKNVTRSGNIVTDIIPAAFFTIDILAGGHGITFGGPAKTTDFRCEMDSVFASSFKFDLVQVADVNSDDYKLNQAITTLGWTNDVIEN